MNFTIYKSEKARWFLNSIIIVLTYYVVAKIGFLSSFNETNACPIWFSSGFAIAIIALLGYKYIPSIFLASLLANFFQFQITGLPVGQSLMLAMIIGVANASEGFVGAYFWRKFKPLTQIFESPSYVIQFIGLVVFIPAFVSSVIGVAGLLIGRVIHFSELPGIWLIWTSGNIVGTLIFAPFVSIGKTIFKFRGPFDIIHKLKHTFYWLIVIVISWLTISGKANEFAQTNIELKYIILLLLVWQIIRYKQIGGFVFIIIISLISVFYTLNEVGVFVGQTDKDSFLVLQSFLGMMAIFTLFLSSAFKSNIKTLGLIKESEEKYKALYDNEPDMHVSVDPNTAEILQCNHTLINKLGYSKSEIIGQPIFKMYHPDCMDDVKKAFQSFVETGEVNNAELQLRRKDGSIIEVSLNVSAVRDEIGNIIYSRSAWREITDQKLAEEVLIRSEERYKGIVQSTASCIAVYEALDDGEDFVFIDFNPKAEEVEQISKNDLIGKKVTDVFPGVTEFGLFKVFQNVWKTGSPEHLPVSVYEDDRIQGYRENYVYKLSTGEIVAVYQDLTKGKQAEE
ncbi:MAG: PAS domain S-box protein, partial [Bacteroidetes bacterium]|nr:PAS domain S-box protein [Bacteroidota bacterium]